MNPNPDASIGRPATLEAIRCAYCHGKGSDPFAIAPGPSTCGCCGGRGSVPIATPHVQCAYCRGTGSSRTYRCPVCGGAGAIAAIAGPTRDCPTCGGHAFEASGGLPCPNCRGRG